MKRSVRVRNFDIFSGHAHYVPGYSGILVLLLLLLAGACLGAFATSAIALLYAGEIPAEYTQLVSYPLMFVPALLYAGVRSRRNELFEQGYALNSAHFGDLGWPLCALMVSAATLAAAFMTDLVSAQMPPMPKWLEDALGMLADGNIWAVLLCVSVLAPLCEEWLCRGMILRGLLNRKKADGSALVSPAAAIVISALFFAFIHFNPWQAVPAFILGCLFGYVYYRTGSLWLTMLMHCVNNTFSTICSNIEAFDGKNYWTEVMPAWEYAILFAAGAILLVLFVRAFNRIGLQSPAGNCDPTKI